MSKLEQLTSTLAKIEIEKYCIVNNRVFQSYLDKLLLNEGEENE